MKKSFSALLLVLSLFVFCSCSNKAYNFQFESSDIKKITINSDTSDIVIENGLIEEFFEGLKKLEYKSYSGQVKGKEPRKIEIILMDNSSCIFEAYYIIRNDNEKKYKCDTTKYNTFLDKYVST